MSPSHSVTRLEVLPRTIVIEALRLFGFAEFEVRDTHMLMWGTRPDGTGVILRIRGFEEVPATAQETFLAEAHISIAQWLFTIARVRAKQH